MDRFELWRSLLETAIYTPSPHNVQPWRIRLVSDRDAELSIDGNRTLPKEDTTGSFILSAMGMFVEAIALLAAPRGFELEYELRRPPEWYARTIIHEHKTELLPFARLRLIPGPPRENPYPESLFLQRRTSRISFLPTPVENIAVASLTKLASQWGQRYEQITDSAQIENILAQNTDALFADLNTPAYHDEIVSWFRFTDRSAKRLRDGLDWRCMNTSRLAFWLAARVPKILVAPLTRSVLKRQYRRQLGLVPTIGLLAGDFFQPSGAFETGRFLIRFWLNWLAKTTNIQGIWLIFKIGHSQTPPKSYRRLLADALVT
jgi:nitroreductase